MGLSFSSNSEGRIGSYDYADYHDSEASSTIESELNGTTANIDAHYLEELRQHIDVLSSETYRSERVIWAIAYSAIILLSAVGNSLVVRVCLRSMTRTNLLILCLAASDLTMTVMNVPFNYFRLLHYSWPFGSAMCFTVNFVQHLVVYVSSYTMAIIAIQRYRSVCSLQFEPSHSSKRRCCGQGKFSPNHGNSGGGANDCDRHEDGDDGYHECQLSPAKMANRFGRCCTMLGHLCAVFSGTFKKLFVWSTGGNNGGGGGHHSSFPRGPHQLHSLRPIFLCIGTTWLVASFAAALFTYSSVVVARNDFFALILNLYQEQQQQLQPALENNGTATEAGAINGTQLNSTVTDELKIDFEAELAKHVMNRCQNPMPAPVVDFLGRHSVRAELAKSVIIFLTQYFIPLAISCVLYIRIGKIIKVQGRLATVRGNPKARIRQRKKRRRILMLVLVVCAFALSWLPIHVFHILVDAGVFEYNYQIFMVVHWLAMSSVSYNPWIYCSLNKSFRKAALRVFCCCCLEEDDELSSKGGASHHDHFSNEGRLGSSRLLSKVPCCTKKLAGKKEDEISLQKQRDHQMQQKGGNDGDNSAMINGDDNGHDNSGRHLPAPRGGCGGGSLDPSCFGNMSCVTETSMIAYTSAGSIERLNHDDEDVVPVSVVSTVDITSVSAAVPKKRLKFNFFRKKNRLGSGTVDLCQIKIEECSDKTTDGSGHSSVEVMLRLNQNENLKQDDKAHFSDSIDSEEDESDECLLNEGRSPGSRTPRPSIEMQSMQMYQQMKQQKQKQRSNSQECSVDLLMDCDATPEKSADSKTAVTEKEVKFACGDDDDICTKSPSNEVVVDCRPSLALLMTDL